MEYLEPKNNQNAWNFLYTLFFVAVFAGSMWVIQVVNGTLPTFISLGDFLLIALATFRLVRLFVYDKITKFFRDWFMVSREVKGERGEIMIARSLPLDGPRRTAADLLACPWCTGVWFAMLISFFYFLTPYSWYVILILAISGVATMVQLFANMIGWRAERLKQKATKGE